MPWGTAVGSVLGKGGRVRAATTCLLTSGELQMGGRLLLLRE